MLMKLKSAALAAPCIRVRYTGKYAYASLVLVKTAAAPILSLGVSDVSLADSVTNTEVVITGNLTFNLRDVVQSINNWLDTTSTQAVLQGDFQAELYNALYSDIFGNATAAQFETAAGTVQLKNVWGDALIKDDNANGSSHTSLMIAPPSMSHGMVVIKEITGHPGTSGTPTVVRSIYDMDGNLLASSGSIGSATDALLAAALPAFAEPVILCDGPVIVRDTVATCGHNDATTMRVMYGFPQAKNF